MFLEYCERNLYTLSISKDEYLAIGREAEMVMSFSKVLNVLRVKALDVNDRAGIRTLPVDAILIRITDGTGQE